MAEFAHQYLGEMLKRQHHLAQTYPEVIKTDPMYTTDQLYSLNLMQLLLMGVIMKVISQVGGVTDEQWIAALDQAINDSPEFPWPAWVLNKDPDSMPS